MPLPQEVMDNPLGIRSMQQYGNKTNCGQPYNIGGGYNVIFIDTQDLSITPPLRVFFYNTDSNSFIHIISLRNRFIQGILNGSFSFFYGQKF